MKTRAKYTAIMLLGLIGAGSSDYVHKVPEPPQNIVRVQEIDNALKNQPQSSLEVAEVDFFKEIRDSVYNLKLKRNAIVNNPNYDHDTTESKRGN